MRGAYDAGMKIYEVGGAVRDALLGLPVVERDWVVVGGSADELAAQGFRRVGKDFPVFLHPRTGEEYALARTERKTAPGYTGFTFDAAPTVTLEDDLKRGVVRPRRPVQDGNPQAGGGGRGGGAAAPAAPAGGRAGGPPPEGDQER